MSVIYEPKGRAREYSPLSLNLYLECSHECRYCYAPSALQRKRESYFKVANPRKNIIPMLAKELEKTPVTKQVMLSFIGDVYCESLDNNETTRQALLLLHAHKVPVSILTKGCTRSMKHIELFKSFGSHFQIGTTLTFDNDKDSLDMEKGANTPKERLDCLKAWSSSGIKTFASFEPVIDPVQSINLLKYCVDNNIVDTFKIGKINNFEGRDKAINWTSFLSQALDILRPAGKDFYIKEDLRNAAPSIKLVGKELLPDVHNVC